MSLARKESRDDVIAAKRGKLVDAIREVLDPWLGNPRLKQGAGRFTLGYRFEPLFAARLVQATLIARLFGDPWKGDG